jgi:glycosyltransferase involved in cell wall biosynthesis
MNIAEITTYKEGGVYTHVSELVKRLPASCILITGNTRQSGYQETDGMRLYHVPCILSLWEIYFINPPGSYKKVQQVLQDNNVQLVHLHGPLFTFGGGLIRKLHLPKIMTTHYVLEFKGNKVLQWIYRIIIRWVTTTTANNVDKIICVNEEYLPIYEGWGVDRDKLMYIPNGIDTVEFSPGKSMIKKKLDCKHLVIFWGRLGYQKNIQLLIKAFKKIKTADTKLVIIGKGPDLTKLRNLAGDATNIIFTGYLSNNELIEYARGADVAVLPSRGESWGLVVGEAMACELPVITSNVGKAREFLAENRGILLDNDSVETLAGHIDYLLNNPAIAKDMGKRGRQYVKERYSWEEVAKQTEQLYASLLGSQKDAATQGSSISVDTG